MQFPVYDNFVQEYQTKYCHLPGVCGKVSIFTRGICLNATAVIHFLFFFSSFGSCQFWKKASENIGIFSKYFVCDWWIRITSSCNNLFWNCSYSNRGCILSWNCCRSKWSYHIRRFIHERLLFVYLIQSDIFFYQISSLPYHFWSRKWTCWISWRHNYTISISAFFWSVWSLENCGDLSWRNHLFLFGWTFHLRWNEEANSQVTRLWTHSTYWMK